MAEERMHGGRILAAMVLAPLAVVLVNVAMGVVSWVILWGQGRAGEPEHGGMVWPDPTRPVSYVFDTAVLFSIYGVPTGYVTMVAFWLPLYALVRWVRWDFPWMIGVLSLSMSVPAIVFWDGLAWGWLIVVFLLIHGLAVSVAFLWISGLGRLRHRLHEPRP